MQHSYSDNTRQLSPADDNSATRLERLLRDANNAAALRHALAMIDIEGAHRLAWHRSHFNQDQPRVPAGHPDGGQWTNGGGGGNDSRVISDAPPDNDWKPGAQYAQSRRGRGSGSGRGGGRFNEPEPGQAARLALAEARAHDAISRVRELDPKWRPQPSAFESVEGLIRTYEAEAVEAEARIAELARNGIGPGPFAGESIAARGPGRDFNVWERREGNRIFARTGCHTCGTFDAGTPSGNCVLDHQPPTAWNPYRRVQRLYPHCLGCSSRQGNWISRNRGR
jgi:hypothetical protein